MRIKKISFFIPIVLVSIVLLVLIIREPYENDRMPNILTPTVSARRITKEEFYDSKFHNGVPCKEDQEVRMKIQTIAKTTNAKDFPFCQQFQLRNSIFYMSSESFEGGSIVYLLVRLPNQEFIDVLRPEAGYPGYLAKNFKTDGKSVIFQFEGWHNPRKYIKLSLER